MVRGVVAAMAGAIVLVGGVTACGSSGGGSPSSGAGPATSSSSMSSSSVGASTTSPSTGPSSSASSTPGGTAAGATFAKLPAGKLSQALLTAADVKPVLGTVQSKTMAGPTPAGGQRTKLSGSGGTCKQLAPTSTSQGIVSGKPSAQSAIVFVKAGKSQQAAASEVVQQYTGGASPSSQLTQLDKLVSGCTSGLTDTTTRVKVTVKPATGMPSYGDKTVAFTETESRNGVTVVSTIVGVAAGKNFLQLHTAGTTPAQTSALLAAAWKQANHPSASGAAA